VDPFETGYQSEIAGFVLPHAGVYHAVVATFSNAPVLNTNGVAVSWLDAGGGNIHFGLLVRLLPSRLTIRQAGEDLVTVEWGTAGNLQSEESLTNGWADVLSASTPHVFAPESPQRFFRLRPP
jgi:hypothetical protein